LSNTHKRTNARKHIKTSPSTNKEKITKKKITNF